MNFSRSKWNFCVIFSKFSSQKISKFLQKNIGIFRTCLICIELYQKIFEKFPFGDLFWSILNFKDTDVSSNTRQSVPSTEIKILEFSEPKCLDFQFNYEKTNNKKSSQCQKQLIKKIKIWRHITYNFEISNWLNCPPRIYSETFSSNIANPAVYFLNTVNFQK